MKAEVRSDASTEGTNIKIEGGSEVLVHGFVLSDIGELLAVITMPPLSTRFRLIAASSLKPSPEEPIPVRLYLTTEGG